MVYSLATFFYQTIFRRRPSSLLHWLGHLIPEFQHAIAKREIDMITSIGHIKNFDALTKFISFSELTEAKEDLQSGKTLSIQAQSEYAKKNYHMR